MGHMPHRTNSQRTSAQQTALDTIDELYDRQMAILYPSSALPEEDRAPGAFNRLSSEIDLAVRAAFNAGLPVTAIFQSTSLSRKEVIGRVEVTKPPAAADPWRADELARNTRMFGAAAQCAGTFVTLHTDGDEAAATRIRAKFLAFFGEWAKAQRDIYSTDPDSLAILSALDAAVRTLLRPATLAERVQMQHRYPITSRHRDW